MRFETCCFSGHRVIPKDVREPLREALEREIRFLIKCGLYCFCSGGAKGFDLMAAQIVLELNKENPRLELRMILPFREQAESWSPKEQEEYYSVLKLADRKEYVCGEKYSTGCYRKRNQRLVDESDFCLFYMTRKKSGTGMTLKYAIQRNRLFENLAEDPLVLERNQWGAGETAGLAGLFGCRCAILKERSPSCGHGAIYDGTFSGCLTEGSGVTAQLLEEQGIPVYGESQIAELLK